MNSDDSRGGCLAVIVGILVVSQVVRGLKWLAGFAARHWVELGLGLAAVAALFAVVGLVRAVRRARRARRERELWFVEFPPDPPPLPPSAPPPDPAQPSCLVCHGGLGSDVVYCYRCGTPHHRECFRYAGSCSVYACGSRRYRRAAPAAREYTLHLT